MKYRKICLSLILLLFVSGPEVMAQRSIRAEDLLTVNAVSNPRISPRGHWVAFEVLELSGDDVASRKEVKNIWLVATDGHGLPFRFAFSDKNEKEPRWSPGGTAVAFLSERGGVMQVWRKKPDDDDAVQITRMKKGVTAFEWLDNNRLAFLAEDTSVSVAGAKSDAHVVGEKGACTRLWEKDFMTGRVTVVTPSGEHVVAFDYSPDRSRVVLRVAPSSDKDDISFHSQLVILDRRTGRRQLLGGTDGRFSLDHAWGSPRWSPDGKKISSFVTVKITYLPVLFDVATGRGHVIAKDFRGTLWELIWHPRTGELYFSGNKGVQGIYGKIDLPRDSVIILKKVNRSFSEVHNWSFSAGGRRVAYQDASYDSPDDIWLMRPDGSHSRRLTVMNPRLQELAFGRQQVIRWKSYDGQIIEGVLITPPDYDPSHPYPLVVQIHGGPLWAWWNGYLANWHEWAQLLAAQGFVMLYPNPRGSNGYGWRFACANISDWGGGDYQDIMAGVDYLIEKGIADSSRLAIGGWSYGGFLTAWALTQTHRFRTGVMGAAVTDLTTMYSTSGRPENFRRYFEGSPYVSRGKVFREHSPVTFTGQVETPVLILHGEEDAVVPLSQSYEYYQGLKDHGVTCRFVTYPREGHGISETAHRLDLMNRLVEWFTYYLNDKVR